MALRPGGVPFFVGLANVSYSVAQEPSSDPRAARYGFPRVKAGTAYTGPGAAATGILDRQYTAR